MSPATSRDPEIARAILWDLDGTLVDSEEYHWQAWHETMRREGTVITREQFRESFGQRNDRILRNWLGQDVAANRLQRIGDEKEAEYRRLAQTRGLVPLPGAAEWTRRLHEAGWRQAIASSAPRRNAELMLRLLGLSAYFDAIVAAEDVSKGKPDPDVFLAAASRLGVDPHRCVVVEDAAAGIEAGRRGGMRTVGVSRTPTLEADVFVRSLADLPPDAFDRLIR
jgi:beta-phosphoglucomutase